MARKPLESTWELPKPQTTREDLSRVLGDCDFDYFTSHFQQIVDKSRQLVPMKLNRFQQEVFKKLLPLVDPRTRINHSKTAVFVKSRRVGATTGMIAFINFLLSYVDGIENLNVLHLFPAADTAAKLYNSKVKDIITGVHPELMPTIYKESGVSSIVLDYSDLLGVRRHNTYELASASATSLRGSDFHVAILDEAASYRHPEDVEAVVAPMMPPHGFSLTVFASTFDDKMGSWYKDKIVAAMKHPDEYELIFVPWFASYPEQLVGVPFEEVELTKYDQEVVIPAMMEYGLPREAWGDALVWRHRMEATMSEANMRKEFPTTLEEVLAIGENKSCFTEESLAKQDKNILPDHPYQLVTDVLTKKVELKPTDESPIMVYKAPVQGQRYMLTCDPIGSNSDDSDFFAASVWNMDKNEQVATLYAKGLMIEDMADMVVGLAQIYNRAVICSEKNMGEALHACIRAKGYYNLYYQTKNDKAKKDPGIRTTVSSKPAMLDKLQTMLDRESIIIHSAETLRQLKEYERKVKSRSGGGSTIQFSAPKGDHDDFVSTTFLYAGTRSDRELMGKNVSGFAVCW